MSSFMSRKQIIIFLSIIGFFQSLLNILLKHVCYYYSSQKSWIKRPNSSKLLGCGSLGMPSGHTETTTVFCLTLIWYYKLPVRIGLMIIVMMMLQRIMTKMHTVRQVIAGFFTGYVYSYIYILTGYSYKTLSFVGLMIYVYLTLIERYISKQMKKIPDWINKDLLSIIRKKQDRTFIQKTNEILLAILDSAYVRNYEYNYVHNKKHNQVQAQNVILYYSYQQLQEGLDNFIENILSKMDDIDIVVGIKTGGAILGKYIADKLGKTYYSIKPKHKKFKCEKNEMNQASGLITHIENEKNNYEICETISEDIRNKTVLLIDETVGSGGTMNTSIKYLKDEKQVKVVYPYIYNVNNMFPSISDVYVFIWPWGYDN